MSRASEASDGVRFDALPAVSRTRQVREQLQAAIERGDYRPGDRLPSERELVDMLGVSRVIVREAIRSLEAVGMVEVQQGRGCFVTASRSDEYATSFRHWLSVHRDEVFELLKVRGALDELAAESAATDADEGYAAQLRTLNDRFSETAEEDIETRVAADVAFHNAIAAASGNRLLRDLLEELHKTFNESRQAILRTAGRLQESVREHDALIDAIERRDPVAARAAVAAHLDSVRTSLTDILAARDA
jgi:GntR family transcriptional repressor for pyruvate dehydrogenase complex